MVVDKVLRRIKFLTSDRDCFDASSLSKQKSRSQFIGVIAALDGLAVKVEQSKNVPESRSYYNRKSFFAVFVQASCIADFINFHLCLRTITVVLMIIRRFNQQCCIG